MPTPRLKPRPALATQSRKDWKDHPLAISVAVAVATSVFFMTVVVPLRVDLLTLKLERLKELSESAVSTAKELERVKLELAETRAALQASLLKAPFRDRSIYPLNFDAVVIGTPESELINRYPDGEWNEERDYYSVKAKVDGVVRGGTYYLQRSGGQRKVSHILFHLSEGEKAGTDLTRKHLLASFGEPDATSRRKQLWKATDREWVTLNSSSYYLTGSFVVYAANSSYLTDFFGLSER